MDDPGVPIGELDRALAYIRLVNRAFRGARGLIRHLERWRARWPTDRPVTMLDVGTGSADIPAAARAWALARGLDLRITAIDNHASTLVLARRFLGSCPEGCRRGIELAEGDALGIVERFGAGSFDYVHAGMFLHHLSDLRVLTMLAMMDRVARAGIVWNDLSRSWLSAIAIEPMLLGRPRIVRHDARVSVRAGFTRREVNDIARRVGVDAYARYHPGPLLYRFTLAGEKPRAWE